MHSFLCSFGNIRTKRFHRTKYKFQTHYFQNNFWNLINRVLSGRHRWILHRLSALSATLSGDGFNLKARIVFRTFDCSGVQHCDRPADHLLCPHRSDRLHWKLSRHVCGLCLEVIKYLHRSKSCNFSWLVHKFERHVAMTSQYLDYFWQSTSPLHSYLHGWIFFQMPAFLCKIEQNKHFMGKKHAKKWPFSMFFLAKST